MPFRVKVLRRMTSVAPFCGVHTELYSHVEWGLLGWCLCVQTSSSYVHIVLFLCFYCVLCGFCVLFATVFAFLAALFVRGANAYRKKWDVGGGLVLDFK